MSIRRNVLIEAHNTDAVHPNRQNLLSKSLEIDPYFSPLQLTPPNGIANKTTVVCAKIHHDDIEELEAHPDIVKVWSNFEIGFFGAVEQPAKAPTGSKVQACPLPPCDCDFHKAKGSLSDVANYIGAQQAWQCGVKGAGVAVGIVGGGITATGRPISNQDTGHQGWPGKLIPSVTNGWPKDWGTTGVTLDWHGNAMATGTLGMAPEVEIYDMRIVEPNDEVEPRCMVSQAIAAYDWGLAQFKATGKPQVLNNSWGVYSEASAPDYAVDPDHPFTRKVEEVIESGMIVLFAAGNCGISCPAPTCGQDKGPGRSIWGANGAPSVMCVAAANTLGQYVGYSSQGPAALDKSKPDFCGITHYAGYTKCDYGTSSACAIASGVAALLKCGKPEAGQFEINDSLKKSARQIGDDEWNPYSGFGIIHADAALKLLIK